MKYLRWDALAERLAIELKLPFGSCDSTWEAREERRTRGKKIFRWNEAKLNDCLEPEQFLSERIDRKNGKRSNIKHFTSINFINLCILLTVLV